jgi:3'(2'), 5'-bisphosphate nucleotidase
MSGADDRSLSDDLSLSDDGSLSDDLSLAVALAGRAGALLLQARAESFAAGATGKEIGRRGDLSSNELLLAGLAADRPDDAVLSEESADDLARLDAERVWIIDPLDGTREYSMAGRTDWAVHVALWERGPGITAAAVGLPALDRVLTGHGDAAVLGPLEGPIRTVVSDSRPPSWLGALGATIDLEVRPMGSAGAKAMAVVAGEADAYVHSGGQYEWDSAAPVGVVQAAGLHASRLDGSPLRYNLSPPYLPDLVICRRELAEPLLAALAAVGAA